MAIPKQRRCMDKCAKKNQQLETAVSLARFPQEGAA